MDEIREMIDAITDDVRKVKAKHGEILADPNTDDSKSNYTVCCIPKTLLLLSVYIHTSMGQLVFVEKDPILSLIFPSKLHEIE